MNFTSLQKATIILIVYYLIARSIDLFRAINYYLTFEPDKVVSKSAPKFIMTIFVAILFYRFILTVKPWNELEPHYKSFTRFISTLLITDPINSILMAFLKILNIIVIPPVEEIKTLSLKELQTFLMLGLGPYILILIIIYYKFSEKFTSRLLKDGGMFLH